MLKDKVVIITGGTSGIGKALAFALGNEGCKVIITGRNEANLLSVSQALILESIDNLAINADVSLEDDNRKVVEQTIEKYGKIDLLINNAGLSMRAMFDEADIDSTFRKLMDVNFFGAVYATQAALPYIKASKGSIVGISSIAGFRGLPVRAGYSASKFALNGFLEAIRTELLHTGVHVLTACPGFTASNIRFAAVDKDGNSTGETVRNESNMMSAEECAQRIVEAIKKRKRTLVLTRQGKLTVLMNKFLPKLTDTLVFNTLAKEKDSPLNK